MHGRWKSDLAKEYYLRDEVDSRLIVLLDIGIYVFQFFVIAEFRLVCTRYRLFTIVIISSFAGRIFWALLHLFLLYTINLLLYSVDVLYQ